MSLDQVLRRPNVTQRWDPRFGSVPHRPRRAARAGARPDCPRASTLSRLSRQFPAPSDQITAPRTKRFGSEHEFRIASLLGEEPVALAANGPDPARMRGVLLDLLAQAGDMNIDCP